MRPYLSVCRMRVQQLLAYRSAALASVLTQVFFGVVITSALRAYYSARAGAVQPIALNHALGYVWLSQAFFGLLPWRPDPDTQHAIRTGSIAFDLLRPVNLYGWWFARAVALKIAPVCLRTGPVLLVGCLAGDLQLPSSLTAAGLWLLAAFGALTLSAAFTVLVTVFNFKMLTADGLQVVLPIAVSVLSGQLVPLPLLPDRLQPLINALPFRGLIDTPNRIWLGDSPVSSASLLLAHQWCWIALIIAAGRMAQAAGLRRAVFQGG